MLPYALSLLSLLCPQDQAALDLHTKEQRAFLTDPVRETVHELELTPREIDLSLPRPQTFRWTSPEKGVLQIAADPEFKELLLELPGKGELPVYNLPLGRKCFWRVCVEGQCSEIRSFTTSSQPPRVIHLPDVTNVRDLGGWKTVDDRRIRQGMIYRGAQLYAERLALKSAELSAEGNHVLLQQLKVRTELDLRREEAGGLHPALRYECIPLKAYATWGEQGIFSAEQKAKIRRIFHMLTDPAVYPLYVHCAGGGDRTGTLCFLIEAALGTRMEDMITDYEYSNLSTSGERSRFSKVWVAFMKRLGEYPGNTIQEQVTQYLLECGVTPSELKRLKELLLTEN